MSGLLSVIRDFDRHRQVLGDYPQGAQWPHAVAGVVRAATHAINLAMRAECIPLTLALDVEPTSQRVIRRLMVLNGSDVKIVRLQLLDNSVIVGGRAVFLKGEQGPFDLVATLIDAIETSLIPKPVRGRGRPRKVPLPAGDGIGMATWPPARPPKSKRKPERKPVPPKRPPSKKGVFHVSS